MADTNTATIIRDQIGLETLYMLGAKDLLAGKNYFQFKVRGSKKANTVKITLDADDTYHVECMKVRFMRKTGEFKVKHSLDVSGVYCDQLRAMLREGTGLETRLF